jgi:hypothetical protein
MTRPCFITWCRWNQPTTSDRNLLILKHDAVLATHRGERGIRAFTAIEQALVALDRNAGVKIVADWVLLQL